MIRLSDQAFGRSAVRSVNRSVIRIINQAFGRSAGSFGRSFWFIRSIGRSDIPSTDFSPFQRSSVRFIRSVGLYAGGRSGIPSIDQPPLGRTSVHSTNRPCIRSIDPSFDERAITSPWPFDRLGNGLAGGRGGRGDGRRKTTKGGRKRGECTR